MRTAVRSSGISGEGSLTGDGALMSLLYSCERSLIEATGILMTISSGEAPLTGVQSFYLKLNYY